MAAALFDAFKACAAVVSAAKGSSQSSLKAKADAEARVARAKMVQVGHSLTKALGKTGADLSLLGALAEKEVGAFDEWRA
eukprot:2927437-Lingulodinium_polyedra.AAC.1